MSSTTNFNYTKKMEQIAEDPRGSRRRSGRKPPLVRKTSPFIFAGAGRHLRVQPARTRGGIIPHRRGRAMKTDFRQTRLGDRGRPQRIQGHDRIAKFSMASR